MLLETVNNFINQLEARIPRAAAVAATKSALRDQLKESNKVTFEVDGEILTFSRNELKEIWNEIK